MHRFLETKSRPNTFQEPPIHPGAEEVELKLSKAGVYREGRNRVDLDGTSHISYVPCLRGPTFVQLLTCDPTSLKRPYLAAGMISPRQCLRETTKLTGGSLRTDKTDGGVGVWVSEVAWRDFYQHVSIFSPFGSSCFCHRGS